MQRQTLQYLRCVRCLKKLNLDILYEQDEIDEGFLDCKKCGLLFPIICGIPVMWDDFARYIGIRPRLGGRLILSAKTSDMRSFLKKSMSGLKRQSKDKSILEDRWVSIYQNSRRSRFYQTVCSRLASLMRPNMTVLEHGCSIGLVTNKLASDGLVFGIDRSFAALQAARLKGTNCEYVIADSLSHPFGGKKFDLVLCLNMLELIDPGDLLKTLSKQVSKGTLVISDPYDFDRGADSVKSRVDSVLLRSMLKDLGFYVDTQDPGFIPWSLSINSRARLHYKVDLVVANRTRHIR